MAGRHSIPREAAKAVQTPLGRTAAAAMVLGTAFGLAAPSAHASTPNDSKALLGTLGGAQEKATATQTQVSQAVTSSATGEWNASAVAVDQASTSLDLAISVEEAPKATTANTAAPLATAQATRTQRATQNTQQATAPAEQEAPVAVSAGSGVGAAIAAKAQTYLGTPYRAGGATPAGWDCSGFVSYLYAQFGYSVPRSSAAYRSIGHQVPYSQVQPGDILVWPGHVAISLGGGRNFAALNPKRGTNYSSDSYYKGTPIVVRVY